MIALRKAFHYFQFAMSLVRREPCHFNERARSATIRVQEAITSFAIVAEP